MLIFDIIAVGVFFFLFSCFMTGAIVMLATRKRRNDDVEDSEEDKCE